LNILSLQAAVEVVETVVAVAVLVDSALAQVCLSPLERTTP
jgi:hypothetical protein